MSDAWTEKLKKVNTIVVHGNCSDGMMSAIILADALRGFGPVQVMAFNHNEKEYLGLEAQPGMLFCDICPPPERIEEFLAVDPIALDHHVTNEQNIKRFKHGVYGFIPAGWSGAVLALKYVWEHICYNRSWFVTGRAGTTRRP